MVHPAIRHHVTPLALGAVLLFCPHPAASQTQSTMYRPWRPPNSVPWARLLTRVDAGVDDSDKLAQPMRHREWGLSEPVGFEGVWRLPALPDDPAGRARYVRADGGLYAVFTTGEYALDGTLPLIPANTVFHIGPPAQLRPEPAPLAPDQTDADGAPVGPRIDVKAYSKLGGDTAQRFAVALPRPSIDSDDPDVADPTVESADVRLPRIRQAETERASRVREILRRAVTDPDTASADEPPS